MSDLLSLKSKEQQMSASLTQSLMSLRNAGLVSQQSKRMWLQSTALAGPDFGPIQPLYLSGAKEATS